MIIGEFVVPAFAIRSKHMKIFETLTFNNQAMAVLLPNRQMNNRMINFPIESIMDIVS